ncbi:hypothetical protein [Actinokineospora sp. NBRC 105648]|uniref:hypothetical protein n=1 Tax=Actinokineospora sp. NBRC 105648 TaxID=3032206 RepID=UPI0024A20203|nr:hypothetical protein [Actinokineospora sp. NBRC 105648]GLZ41594.1 hypothetical protein Acsp05_52180 [Actinokineospora sp. NBRC 105648]
MPRRRPDEIRAHLRVHPQHRCTIPQIPHVSAATSRAIAALDRTRFHPGATARALAGWRRFTLGPAHRLDDCTPEDCPCDGCQWDDPVVQRQALAVALHTLPTKAARELRALVLPLDETYLARATPTPEAAQLRTLLLPPNPPRPQTPRPTD